MNDQSEFDFLDPPAGPEKRQRFLDFHGKNPHVYAAIKRFTWQAIHAGREHYGVNSVIERVRWYTDIETKGDLFKINNNYAPYYARLFMRDFPEHDGFFRTREMGDP